MWLVISILVIWIVSVEVRFHGVSVLIAELAARR